MKKIEKILAMLCSVLVMTALCFMAGCNSETKKTTLEGAYYTEVTVVLSDGTTAKRGCDLYVLLNADESIYTIALDDESPYQCADSQVLWSIKSSGFFNNLATLGIDGISKLNVVCDASGLPVQIDGMDETWLVPMNTAGCGMVVLALQNAFASL